MISLITEVLWLAAALGVLSTVVLVILPEAYEHYKYNKHDIDTESRIYTIVVDAIEEHKETGKPVTILISGEEHDDEETNSEEE